MWIPLVKKRLTKEEFKEWETMLPNCDCFKHKLMIITQVNSLVTITPKQVVDYLLANFTNNFKHPFQPTNPTLLCHKCKQSFNKHIQCSPCGHIICQNCIQNDEFAKCQVCASVIQDISFSLKICKQQLQQIVKCTNSKEKLETLQYFQRHEINEQNLKLYFDTFQGLSPECLVTAQQYNKYLIPQEILDKLPSFTSDGLSTTRYTASLDSIQLNDDDDKISLFFYQVAEEKVQIPICNQTIIYESLQNHIQTNCQHSLQRCKKCNCSVSKYNLKLHEQQCFHQVHTCPLCFSQNLVGNDYTQHLINCLNKLTGLVQQSQYEIHESISMTDINHFELTSYDEDEELLNWQKRAYLIDRKISKLSDKILTILSKQQVEVLNNKRAFRNMLFKKLLPEKLYNVFNYMFNTHQLAFLFWLGVPNLLILDLVTQLNRSAIRPFAIIFAIIFFLMSAVQIIFEIQLLYSQFYKIGTFIFAMKTYLVMSFYYEFFYLNVFRSDNQQFSGIIVGLTDSQTSQDIFSQFINFMYFSLVSSNAVGFGDIVPKGLVVKVVVFTQSIFATFMIYIIFRGMSFFLSSLNYGDESKKIFSNMQKAVQKIQQMDDYELEVSQRRSNSSRISLNLGRPRASSISNHEMPKRPLALL